MRTTGPSAATRISLTRIRWAATTAAAVLGIGLALAGATPRRRSHAQLQRHIRGRGPSRSVWLGLVAVVAVLAAVLGAGQLPASTLSQLGAPVSAPAPGNAPAADTPVIDQQWPAGLRQAATAAVTADAYLARPHGVESWQASNPAQQLGAAFAPTGVSVAPTGTQAGAWTVGLALTGIGRGPVLAPVPAPRVDPQGARVDYHRGSVREWYVNDTRGLQQGFTLATPPAGAGPVTVGLDLTGNLTPRLTADARGLVLTDPATGVETARYDGLVAFDATGATLPAHLELSDPGLSGSSVRLVVDDTTATYPVTIDPVISTQQAKLTAPDAAADDQFGSAVAVSGDTAVVGAPLDDGADSDEGSGYVFTRSGGTWTQQALEFAEFMHRTCVTVDRWWDEQDLDLLLTPTLARRTPPMTDYLPPPDGDYDVSLDEPLSTAYALAALLPLVCFTQLYNWTGQPAVSLPLGVDDDGLPVGIQLAARRLREDHLLDVAAELETARPWAGRLPAVHAAIARTHRRPNLIEGATS